MKPVAPSSLDAQLYGLSTLIQLLKRSRHVATAEELAFVMVNETHALLPYRQAALWQRDGHAMGRIIAVSGAVTVERNAPYMLWLNRAFASFDKQSGVRNVDAGHLDDELGGDWAEWLPAQGLLMPIGRDGQSSLGALLLARDQPWTDGERLLLQELTDGYGIAWSHFRRARRQALRNVWHGRRGLIRLTLAAVLFAAMWLPITLSALAPAEVVALRPTIVRAPLEGVVDRFEVQPNQPVTEGQLLLVLDPRAIENKLEVASKALAVAEAEYRQAAQSAVFEDKSRALLAVLKGRAEQRRADVTYNQSLLDRIKVTATRSGIALFDDPNAWIGRPVAIGERLIEIADPVQAELEIWLPVADAITLKEGANVDFFLNVSPDAPLRAHLRQASYEATQSPTGLLGYRLKATLPDGTKLPRIGLKGTAKVYGEKVTLFYYLLRRPLAAGRQFVGL